MRSQAAAREASEGRGSGPTVAGSAQLGCMGSRGGGAGVRVGDSTQELPASPPTRMESVQKAPLHRHGVGSFDRKEKRKFRSGVKQEGGGLKKQRKPQLGRR